MEEENTIARIFKPDQVGRPGEVATARVHQCDWCGAKDFWHGSWSWYGSYRDMEENKIVKCCGCCNPSEQEGNDMLRKKHGVNRKRS
jgi:hypothetical protein